MGGWVTVEWVVVVPLVAAAVHEDHDVWEGVVAIDYIPIRVDIRSICTCVLDVCGMRIR